MSLMYYKALNAYRDNLPSTEKVLKEVLDMQLFVIEKTELHKYFIEDKRPLDLPFRNMIIEVLDSNIMYGVYERGPNDYTFYKMRTQGTDILTTWSNPRHRRDDTTLEEIETREKNYIEAKETIRHLLDRNINTNTYACETNPRRPLMLKKSGKKSKKKATKTSSVIYISRTKNNNIFTRLAGQALEFSKSFLTRGHWRKCKGIGKDRQGNRSVKGFTWVNEHKRGNGPMIEQLRILRD